MLPDVSMDFLFNGQGSGDVVSMLLNNNFDTDVFRPYLGDDGRTYINQVQNGEDVAVPINNVQAVLRKDDWLLLDEQVMKAARPALQLVAAMRGIGLEFNVPGGWAKSFLQWERMTNISGAKISMDGIDQPQADRPLFDLNNLPLPLIHKEFQFTARQLAASRQGSSPLDTTTGELAGERVAEMAEQLALGTISATPSYGGYPVYGLCNFPGRLTKTMTLPTANGWTPSLLVEEVIAMRQQSVANWNRGPFDLYVSLPWDNYMDQDYSAAKGENTVRARLNNITGIQRIITLDWLAGYEMILVQRKPTTARLVIGMELTTIQWPSHGNMQQNFKVMMICVPQLRNDIYGNCGIVHGVSA